jgi:hypothetical protein
LDLLIGLVDRFRFYPLPLHLVGIGI